VYFGVWYFICEYETIYIIIITCTIIIIIIVIYMIFFLFQLYSICTSQSYEVLSLCTLSSPLHTKWLEMWRTQMGKRVNYSNLKYLLKTVKRLVWRIIFFSLGEVVDHLLINC
jgi:hypothetical protein